MAPGRYRRVRGAARCRSGVRADRRIFASCHSSLPFCPRRADATLYATEALPFGEPLDAGSAWEVGARAADYPFVPKIGVSRHARAPISWLMMRWQLSLRLASQVVEG